MRQVSRRIVFIFIGSLGLILAPTPASASRYFFEFGGGMSKLAGSDAFFNNGGVSSPGLGTLLQYSLGFRIRSKTPVLGLGLLHRIHVASGGATSYGMQSIYPILKLDLRRIYINLGVSPLVWRRMRDESGFDHYSRQGGIGLLGELGVQFPITYEISFNITASAEAVTGRAGLSPAPALGGVASFRINFGPATEPSSSGSSSSYEGHRYPMGWER